MTHTDAHGTVHEPVASDFGRARPIAGGENDREWYKRAVFYEVLVRAFADSNGDGTGDLRGLIDKLDYLSWLGVDCLWLPPFYDSPLRDGGYDISDYRKVLPEFGNVEDFVALLDAAHERGIRVITDLVMNHTSDAHQWFQESRRHPDGPYGDYYVWARRRHRLPGRPGHLRRHRAEQLDVRPGPQAVLLAPLLLPPTRPELREPGRRRRDDRHPAVLARSGLDGFRLDAVPYLFEEEGTNGENLPKTHEFLKRCRKVIDVEYPNAILLAEANQWPADVVDYFGDPEVGGDECHMCFHFPLMPRIFMAARREQRFPISEILAQTPAIPESGQWGIFLRNHDELTLEMVSDEDRDYMWAEYAKDPRMKANIGIRRRLATLLENDTNQQELFTAMLLSLPGSPVLYYGDEIGMGDNIWLGDRDGVRTPMQWSPDRNAGFSRCDPARLYLPAIMDPIYGFQTVNVEAQMNSTASLLHWTRRMIEIRKQYAAFSVGAVHRPRRLEPDGAVVHAAFRRRHRRHHRASTPCSASTTFPVSRSPSSWTCAITSEPCRSN